MTDQELFSNHPVDLADIPRAEDSVFLPIDPRYRWCGLVPVGLFMLVPLLAISIPLFLKLEGWIMPFLPYCYGILPVIFALAFLYITIGYRHKGYAVREQDILFRHGVIWRKVIAVPFNRLQHAELHRGPVERYYNLASLRLFTAGGMQADMTIPGLPEKEAVKLRDHILNRAGVSL